MVKSGVENLVGRKWIGINRLGLRVPCEIVSVRCLPDGRKVIMVRRGKDYEPHDNFRPPGPER